MATLHKLITILRPESGLRCRTGIVLVPPVDLPELSNFGARNGLDTINYAVAIDQELPATTQFVSLSVDSESDRLRRIADANDGSAVLLITQFDVALARLGTMERARLWRTIYEYLTQTRHGLLFAMPSTASRLLPEEMIQEQWRMQGRIALMDD